MESVSRRRGEDGQTSRLPSRQEQKQAEEPVKKKHIYARYKAPSLDLLQTYAGGAAVDPEEMEHNKNTIVETLSDLRIPCEVVKVTQGPAVTRYDIEIPGNIPTGPVCSAAIRSSRCVCARLPASMFSRTMKTGRSASKCRTSSGRPRRIEGHHKYGTVLRLKAG